MINLRGLGDCFLDEGNTIPCPDSATGILLTAYNPQTGKPAGGSYYAVPVMQNPNASTATVDPLCRDASCLMTGPNPSLNVSGWLINNKDLLLSVSALIGIIAMFAGKRK